MRSHIPEGMTIRRKNYQTMRTFRIEDHQGNIVIDNQQAIRILEKYKACFISKYSFEIPPLQR